LPTGRNFSSWRDNFQRSGAVEGRTSERSGVVYGGRILSLAMKVRDFAKKEFEFLKYFSFPK